jgi:hypothetical protein
MDNVALRLTALAKGKLTDNDRYVLESYLSLSEAEGEKLVTALNAQLDKLYNDTELISWVEKNNNDFKRCVKKLFNGRQNRFVKYDEADETFHPENVGVFKMGKGQKTSDFHRFAYNTIWRPDFYNGFMKLIEEETLEKLRVFQEEQKTPTFLIVGIGSNGRSPQMMFVIPINELENTLINKLFISVYQKKINKLGFDKATQMLK